MLRKSNVINNRQNICLEWKYERPLRKSIVNKSERQFQIIIVAPPSSSSGCAISNKPQWPTTYLLGSLTVGPGLRCRAPGLLLEVVVTRSMSCGSRSVQLSFGSNVVHIILKRNRCDRRKLPTYTLCIHYDNATTASQLNITVFVSLFLLLHEP